MFSSNYLGTSGGEMFSNLGERKLNSNHLKFDLVSHPALCRADG